MKKKFYISSRKDRSAHANALSEKLSSLGWERTYTWTELDGEGPDGHANLAIKDLDGVERADVVIVLLPGGFGTHVEIGAALALHKPIIIHSPDQATLENPYRCVFHYHPSVELIVSEKLDIESLIARMESLTKAKR